MDEMPPRVDHLVRERLQFEYTPLPVYHRDKFVVLRGHFQTPKYFDHRAEVIRSALKLDSHPPPSQAPGDVSLHFRLGDHLQLPEVYPILGPDYYLRALEHVVLCRPHVRKVLWFAEESVCPQILADYLPVLQSAHPQLEFERASSELSDWQQMMLMSRCPVNVIANSTFSWWAAYLNRCSGPIQRMVVAPRSWIHGLPNTIDLQRPGWVLV
jgi:hypothetical protein